jgi:hypothetical protein
MLSDSSASARRAAIRSKDRAQPQNQGTKSDEPVFRHFSG